MQLDLDLAASFLVLTEERHYGRSAARLHLTSSALTKRIQRLERQLGVALVERGPSGVVQVTDAGLRFATEVVPLLAHADAARAAARRRPASYVVRIGTPAGTGDFLSAIGLHKILRGIHRTCPEASFARSEVPFLSFTTSLLCGAIDVLWNSAPERHDAIESILLDVCDPVIGVVGRAHPFADATSVEASTFCEEALLFNPALPPEWMDPFVLADIRPRREAHLVPFAATDQRLVIRRAAEGRDVIAVPQLVRPLLGPHLHALDLPGASPVPFYVSHRRTDNRDAVLALIEAFKTLSRDAFATAGLSRAGSS